MIDLGSMTDKFSETGQKVMRRAIEVSRSHDHGFLSLSHVFTALSEIESALFAEAMRAVGVDPRSVTNLLDQELSQSPRYVGRKMAIPEATRDLLNRALRPARPLNFCAAAGLIRPKPSRPVRRTLSPSEGAKSRPAIE